MPVNAAVIGCGSWGSNHARVYDELPTVNLKAIADLNPQTAKNVGKKHARAGLDSLR